jgi:transposase
MKLVDDPDERFEYPPPACRGCGADLAGEPVAAQRRHSVTDIEPAPAPKVTEHVAQAQRCPCCGAVSEGELPEHVRARASYGPETCAQAANLAVGHHIPIWRSTVLLCQLAGIAVSTGWMARRPPLRDTVRPDQPGARPIAGALRLPPERLAQLKHDLAATTSSSRHAAAGR